MYTVTGQDLDEAGWRLAEVQPGHLALMSQGDPVAFELAGVEGERLVPSSTLRFYGQRFRGERLARRYADIDMHWASFPRQMPDGSVSSWRPVLDAKMLEKYTDVNVYWLSADGDDGQPMAVASAKPRLDGPTGGASRTTQFTDTLRLEESHEWYSHHFTSTETWFWRRLAGAAPQTLTVTVALPGVLLGQSVAAGTRPTLTTEVLGRSTRAGHRSVIAWNGVPVSEVEWAGKSIVQLAGTVPVTSTTGVTNTFTWTALPGTTPDDLYFDWLEVSYPRDTVAGGRPLVVQLPIRADTPPLWVQDLGGTEPIVYEITDPLAPVRLLDVAAQSDGRGQLDVVFAPPFEATMVAARSFWVGSDATLGQAPKQLIARPDPRPTLIGSAADYVVITPAPLRQGAERLAAYRAQGDLRTTVADLDDVYDAYNFGIRHPIAIRNFLADAVATWPSPPRYVVLVGGGNFDMKGYWSTPPERMLMPPNLAWVDPWQGEVDSANLLATVGDDDAVADLAIARLPARSLEELDAVIDKTIAYEAAGPGSWRSRQLFVADNPDSNGRYDDLSDQIIAQWTAGHFDPQRVYLADYIAAGLCQTGEHSGCQAATDSIVDAVNDGVLFVNYTGHASVNNWMHEQVFTSYDIPRLANMGRLPVVFSWTCLDGYWYYPGRYSLAELWLRAPAAGAVAAFAPTGLGVSSGHDILQRGVYGAIYDQGLRTLGDITLAAKRSLARTRAHEDLLHTYTLFGDPALRLRLPTAFEMQEPILLPALER